MNNTNRPLNRLGIFLFGLVLLLVGAVVALAAAVPRWLETAKTTGSAIESGASGLLKETTVSGMQQSWLLIVVPVVCLLLIMLLVVFIFRQGRGHGRALVTDSKTRDADNPAGAVIVDGKVAEQAIQAALKQHPGIVSSGVTTYLVKRTPALSITASVRRGESPRVVREFIDRTVAAWDEALGREVPVLVQITSGLAAQTRRRTRVSTTAAATAGVTTSTAGVATAAEPPAPQSPTST